MDETSQQGRGLSAGMKPATSVFLDLVRFSAALVVAFDHLGDYTGGLWWQFGAFGAPAVTVFFVLSGYVIAYAVTDRESDLTRYAVSRCARLYCVVVPALIITFALGIAGKVLRPAVDWGDTSVIAYVRCLLFTNELWFANVTPAYNGPFWSLGYEAWYYVIFAVACFGAGAWRIALTLLCVATAGPRIMMMFPIWLMGVVAWTLSRRVRMRQPYAGLLWCGSMALLGGLVIWQLHRLSGTHPAPEMQPASSRSFTSWRTYLADYGIGLLVAVNFYSFDLSAGHWGWMARIAGKPLRWLAGATFTLYLLHVPVGQFLAALSPWHDRTLPERILVLGGTFGIVFVVAAVGERRKAAWRKAISFILYRLLTGLTYWKPARK